MTEGNREIIANLYRLYEFMDKDNLSAVVIRSGTNFTYLAGFSSPGTLGRHLELPDSPREVLLIWPRHGEPVLVLNHIAEPLARRDSWLECIELYEGYSESPYAKVAELLKGMGLNKEKIGFEKSYLNATRWEELHKLLPKALIVDCGPLMSRVRWIKTPGEIDVIKTAANILDESYIEVFSEIREADTEKEVHTRIVESCMKRGAQWAHGMLSSSRNKVSYGGESSFPFQTGDIVRNDYVSYYNGYPGHQNRTAVIGQPTTAQSKTYQLVRDIYRATIDRCQPNTRAIDVYRFALASFRSAGFKDRLNVVGHGIGPWWHQQEPYIVDHTDAILETGMVLALEPGVSYWRLQDLILITNNGPELLSAKFNTDEMFVIE